MKGLWKGMVLDSKKPRVRDVGYYEMEMGSKICCDIGYISCSIYLWRLWLGGNWSYWFYRL